MAEKVKKINMIEYFKEPAEYTPPILIEDLRKSTEYPNMGSIAYRLSGNYYKVPDKLHSFYEIAAKNDLGNVIIAGNEYNTRKLCSSFYGWDAIENAREKSVPTFRMQCQFTITAMKFSETSFFLVGNDRGSLECWSIKTDSRGDAYPLYVIGKQSEHLTAVSALDIFKTNKFKSVTGSRDGCIKVWDTSTADLFSTNTMAHAHCNSITGISVCQTNEIFATCSTDRSALIWDLRLDRPASRLVHAYSCGFTDIYWTSADENSELIVLADEGGQVHFVDRRQPDVILQTIAVFDHATYKIRYNGKMFAVTGNLPTVKVFNETSDEIYSNSEAPNHIRDVVWDSENPRHFHAIGWGSIIREHHF